MTLIIKTRTSKTFAMFDMALSCIAWGAFLYLLVSSAAAYFSHDAFIGEHFLLLSDTLLIYLMIALANGMLLMTWASYNLWRFRGRQRRRAATPLLREDMARTFGAFAYQMSDAAADQVMVIHHDEGGTIAAVEMPGAQPLVRAIPIAAVTPLRQRVAQRA